jgi:hypothetical protein
MKKEWVRGINFFVLKQQNFTGCLDPDSVPIFGSSQTESRREARRDLTAERGPGVSNIHRAARPRRRRGGELAPVTHNLKSTKVFFFFFFFFVFNIFIPFKASSRL